eukprot:maker-scaffold2020_size22516-snap-gene-0.6 protein:Tk04281 transcript:maker-scaffold2020_size22516-snap-gene-0.6-mRNA-1 annotation:"udp- c:betagal beta- -n-acetylglucosaminyltransferase 5a"
MRGLGLLTRLLGALVFVFSVIGFYQLGKIVSRSSSNLTKRSVLLMASTLPMPTHERSFEVADRLMQDVPRISTLNVDLSDEDVEGGSEFHALDNEIDDREAEPADSRPSSSSEAQVPLVRDMFQHSWEIPASHICQRKPEAKILVVVITSPSHSLQREAIRDSWGRQVRRRKNMAFIFILGRSSDFDAHVRDEADLHLDIVLTNHQDTYENLSLKTLSALQWFQDHCSQAQYLVKVDDDVFIQIPRLHRFLTGLSRSPIHGQGQKVILGNVASGWAPSRVIDSKYYISPLQYNETNYPSFVTGPSYAISGSAIPALLELAWGHPYVSLEDVFVTGILAEQAHIPRRLVMEFRNNADRIPAKFLGCTLLRTISIHKVMPFEQKELMRMARNPQCGGPTKAARQQTHSQVPGSD